MGGGRGVKNRKWRAWVKFSMRNREEWRGKGKGKGRRRKGGGNHYTEMERKIKEKLKERSGNKKFKERLRDSYNTEINKAINDL